MNPFRADILRETELKTNRKRSLWIKGLVALIVIGLVSIIALERYFFYDAPQLPKDLNTLWSMGKQPSYVLLDKNGDLLARRGPHYGRRINIDDMPKHLVNAFLAIEDRRFYQHHGIDQKGIARAAWVNIRGQRTQQGGSTITQQLVKLLLLTPEQTIRRKVQEMRLARALEQGLDKDEILSLYLNRIYLGNRAYGIAAAARRYFQKNVMDLSLSEAAILAAIPKAPSRFAPHSHPKEAQKRAELVLQAMQNAGFIDQTAHDAALENPAHTVLSPLVLDHGYIFDLALQQARSLTGGRVPDLIISTTIDPDFQNFADTNVRKYIAKEGPALKATQAALVCIDHQGALRAMVGGVSYKDNKFNRAYTAKRQPGSAFKAFVYAAAIEAGIGPSSVRRDEPIEIAGWSPGNYDGGYRGRVTVHEAFRRSINTVAAQITDEIGAEKVAHLAKRFGISASLQALPSIALGAQEITLWDATQAFGVFGNDGLLAKTYLIQKIETSSGETLFTRPKILPSRVFDTKNARDLTAMMQEVVLAGTGTGAQLPGRAIAGKTGTSQQWRDAWFVGFSAQLTTGVWVGNDDNSPMNRVTGGALPTKIWAAFMADAHKELPIAPLNAPPPQLLSASDEGLASFYNELSTLFGNLATNP